MIDETVAEIREMETHSSSVVALKATRALSELCDREYVSVEEFERDLEHNAGVLRRANPSHATLHNAMRRLERSVVGNATSVQGGQQLLEETIADVVADVETAKSGAATAAAEIFEDGDTLLTHDYSTTVLEAIETTTDNGGIDLTTYVTEARPRTIGRKMARALAEVDGVDTRMVIDSAMGYALRECDRLVLGMTCITGGTYYNRVGTFPIVVTAAELGVPVTVVGSSAKVIEEFRFENEFRSPVEVMREPIENVTIENPSYDATPVGMIDQLITDEGVDSF